MPRICQRILSSLFGKHFHAAVVNLCVLCEFERVNESQKLKHAENGGKKSLPDTQNKKKTKKSTLQRMTTCLDCVMFIHIETCCVQMCMLWERVKGFCFMFIQRCHIQITSWFTFFLALQSLFLFSDWTLILFDLHSKSKRKVKRKRKRNKWKNKNK